MSFLTIAPIAGVIVVLCAIWIEAAGIKLVPVFYRLKPNFQDMTVLPLKALVTSSSLSFEEYLSKPLAIAIFFLLF